MYVCKSLRLFDEYYLAERVEKRTLGLLLLRGETVVSMQIEAPPPQKHHRGQAGMGGPGQARSAGRGMPVAPVANAPQGIQSINLYPCALNIYLYLHLYKYINI